jgi:hypothetical protein
MQQTFFNNDRPITVKIDISHITFHFKNEGDREFYDIPKAEWHDKEANWHEHMAAKNWFTTTMADFIDKNLHK